MTRNNSSTQTVEATSRIQMIRLNTNCRSRHGLEFDFNEKKRKRLSFRREREDEMTDGSRYNVNGIHSELGFFWCANIVNNNKRESYVPTVLCWLPEHPPPPHFVLLACLRLTSSL